MHAGALLLAQKKIAHMCDYFVPEEGLEPSSLARHDFESCVYTIPPLRLYATSDSCVALCRVPERGSEV